MRATRKQIWAIKAIAQEKGIKFEELDLYAIRTYGAAIENWQFTRQAASGLIEDLRGNKVLLHEDGEIHGA